MDIVVVEAPTKTKQYNVCICTKGSLTTKFYPENYFSREIHKILVFKIFRLRNICNASVIFGMFQLLVKLTLGVCFRSMVSISFMETSNTRLW